MKTYKKPDGTLWAFEEDGSQDHLITEDMILITDEEAETIRNPPPTPEQIIAGKISAMDDLIKDRINAQAISMNFDGFASAVAAAILPIGEYRQADGAALNLWAARTWQKAEQIRNAFLAGERPEPTWEEVEAELPTYPIPA